MTANIVIEGFGPGGEHLSNDERIAHLTLFLLGIMAVVCSVLIVLAIRATSAGAA